LKPGSLKYNSVHWMCAVVTAVLLLIILDVLPSLYKQRFMNFIISRPSSWDVAIRTAFRLSISVTASVSWVFHHVSLVRQFWLVVKDTRPDVIMFWHKLSCDLLT